MLGVHLGEEACFGSFSKKYEFALESGGVMAFQMGHSICTLKEA